MTKLLCHLLMKVNHVIVANFYISNMSFNAIRENKILAKISEFTVCIAIVRVAFTGACAEEQIGDLSKIVYEDISDLSCTKI